MNGYPRLPARPLAGQAAPRTSVSAVVAASSARRCLAAAGRALGAFVRTAAAGACELAGRTGGARARAAAALAVDLARRASVARELAAAARTGHVAGRTSEALVCTVARRAIPRAEVVGLTCTTFAGGRGRRRSWRRGPRACGGERQHEHRHESRHVLDAITRASSNTAIHEAGEHLGGHERTVSISRRTVPPALRRRPPAATSLPP